ncbi:MAG TPA: ribosome biogenesis GTP-binding protein YihA/YsxC [Deltaproteobacteria bacterium]|jgi:GTP-binding protein|nr:ribosome biogenesis GTP-binding protein YihA/YsxC [Deltaproteobacteria bacterium]HOI05829.1 ribosome biogenesis GTP-binding protein YihA/YsxC [Deltaproteobacteria bacterium]
MMPKIRDAQYAGTVYDKLPGLPQIAFAGRSNVGKSSLINALLNRKSLVKTSKQPGKTRNINFFRVDLVEAPSIYMVDLPGYGYARVPQGMKTAWDELASRYFEGNRDLKLLLILNDVRRNLESEEFLILDLARKAAITPVLIVTKADKLPYSARVKRIREIREASGMDPILASAHSRLGLDEIWERILRETASADPEPE